MSKRKWVRGQVRLTLYPSSDDLRSGNLIEVSSSRRVVTFLRSLINGSRDPIQRLSPLLLWDIRLEDVKYDGSALIKMQRKKLVLRAKPFECLHGGHLKGRIQILSGIDIP